MKFLYKRKTVDGERYDKIQQTSTCVDIIRNSIQISKELAKKQLYYLRIRRRILCPERTQTYLLGQSKR